MKQTAADDTIDSLLENFDATILPHDQKRNSRPVTFWIPVEHRNRYEEIQRQSGGKFSKLLKEIIKRSIEKVPVEKA